MIDPHAIVGSGPEGRIVEKDVKAYLAAHDYASLRVSPAAKALAAKEGLDLHGARRRQRAASASKSPTSSARSPKSRRR